MEGNHKCTQLKVAQKDSSYSTHVAKEEVVDAFPRGLCKSCITSGHSPRVNGMLSTCFGLL